MILSTLLLTVASISVPIPEIEIAEHLFDKLRSTVEDKQTYVMVTLNLMVEPDGRVADCTMGRVVGATELAPTFCSDIVGMRVARPRDHAGRRTHAFINYSTSAFAGSLLPRSGEAIEALLAQPNSTDPDGELQLRDTSIGQNDFFFIDLAIDADGTVRACQRAKKTPRRFVEPACGLARAKTFAIRHATHGEAVPYVRSVRLVAAQQ